MNTSESMNVLRGLLQDVLKVRFEGGSYAKLARAQGYADGYMKALLDAGLADRASLIDVVGDERRKFVEIGEPVPG